MQKITSCLCFNNQAEEAVNFYISIFKTAKIVNTTRWGEEELTALERLPEDIRPGPVGSVRTVTFQLFGQEFMAVNAGSHFTFNDGISFMVRCKTQEEIDYFWEKLSKGGEKQDCGWLKDKYGVSWQIVPAVLDKMINDPDPRKAQRVRKTLLQMKKFDIKGLEQAYKGK
jgi:predicted 3-demethylubiquinone-9 3-methyltransferase (glyoxalase superfamily)